MPRIKTKSRSKLSNSRLLKKQFLKPERNNKIENNYRLLFMF